MIKKMIILLITFIVVGYQILFIYGFGYLDGRKQIETLWKFHDFKPMAYSIWVLDHLNYKIIWLLPILSLISGIWAAWQSNYLKIFLGVSIPIIVVTALYAAVYISVLFIPA